MSDSTPVRASTPFFRRLWVVVTLTALLITMPIAMIVLLTGNVYRKRQDGWHPIGNKARFIYGGLLVLWLVAAGTRSLLQPGGLKQEWANSADPQIASTNPATPPIQSPSKPADQIAPPSASSTPAGSPDMKVVIEPEYHDITITADDDTPFSILRVVLNDRANEEKCDFRHIEITDDMTPEQKEMAQLRTELPTPPMRRGDSVKFGSTCGETLSVTVYTDHGVSNYDFGQ